MTVIKKKKKKEIADHLLNKEVLTIWLGKEKVWGHVL